MQEPGQRTKCRVVETELECTLLEDGDDPIVKTGARIRDLGGLFQGTWDVSFVQLHGLLITARADLASTCGLITAKEAKEFLFVEGNVRAFKGFFPVDQIVFQRMQMKYHVFEDDLARIPVSYLEDQTAYLCLVPQEELSVSPRPDSYYGLGSSLRAPVTMLDLRKSHDLARKAGLLQPVKPVSKKPSFLQIADDDPTLALAGLRIEIERRLKPLFRGKPLTGLSEMIAELRATKILNNEQYIALDSVRKLLNWAAHDEPVEKQSSEWIFEYGPQLLAGLDKLIAERDQKSAGV